MTLHRGDIVTTRFPHAGGNRGKKRPAVIIQLSFKPQGVSQVADTHGIVYTLQEFVDFMCASSELDSRTYTRP